MSANVPKKPDSPPTLPADAPRVCLTVPDAQDPVQYAPDSPVTLIGSRRDCDLSLPHLDVSKIHCAVINTGRALLVRDLLSRSGTFVNEQAVRTRALTPGDALRVGPVSVAVELSPPPPSSARDAAAADADPLQLPVPIVLEVSDRRVEISDEATVFGRRNTADIMLDTSDVSLAHALLFSLDGRPVICDLGSRSGTFVNGQGVELSWLDDGDEIQIGGERLTVRWGGPTPAPEQPAEDAAVGDAACAAQSAERSPARSSGDLGELDEMMASVQMQISAARTRMDARAAELDQRERELVSRAEEFQTRSDAVRQAESRVQQREAQAAAAEHAAQEKLAAAAAREQSWQQERVALDNELATLDQRRAEIEELARRVEEQRAGLEDEQSALSAEDERIRAAGATLEEQQQSLTAASAACSRRENELERREGELQVATEQVTRDRENSGKLQAELAEREAELMQRERDLAERQTALAERETRAAQALRKIEQFKAVLSQASVMLTESTPPADSGTATNPPPSAPGAQPTPAGSVEAAAPATAGSSQPDDADGDLPAPIVDQPMFTDAPDVPPGDWPPELRERFRVLRRVSNKSDSDLMAQLWAEGGEAAAPRRCEQKDKPKKKGRLRWGS